jgi:hypothetical protein
MSTNNIIKKIDLARALHVSPSAVTAWICKGMPCRRDGKIDRARALAWLSENVEVQIGSKGLKGATLSKSKRRDSNGHSDGPDPIAMRARRDEAIARKYELANEMATGRVALIEDVAREFASHLAVIRNHFLGLGFKLAPLLAGKSAIEIKRLLDEEVVRILETLCALDGGEGASEEQREQLVRSRFAPQWTT